MQLDTGLAWEGEMALTFPGTDLMTIVLARGAVGWTALWCRMIVGPVFEFTVYDLPVVLQVSEQLLVDDATGGPAELGFTASLRFTPDGIDLLAPVVVDLDPARIGNTGLL